jgi:hypothetical protein
VQRHKLVCEEASAGGIAAASGRAAGRLAAHPAASEATRILAVAIVLVMRFQTTATLTL